MATDLGITATTQTDIATAPRSAESDESEVTTTRGGAKAGYTLWSFDGTEWKLTKDRSAPGHIASTAPIVPGRFKGQVRAILSIPAE